MPDSCLKVCTRRVTAADGTSARLVTVTGEIDADTSPALNAALLHAVEECVLVYCDLGGIGFFGAAGANVLASAARRAASLGHRLEVRGVRGLTEQIVRIAGLDLIVRVSG
ncbi:STAS domain-containing protein [Actinoplanes sp. NPDC051861]|uniref:STAS domain-containing protein n=1 Tax=Actinoplanes sp. NPDC051861 TaxID=3155170 RepID=UPI003439355B